MAEIIIDVTEEIIEVVANNGAYPLPYPVYSVFGRTGTVVAAEGDYTLTQLAGVTITSPANGQVLKYNGTQWVNSTDADTGITTLNTLTALSQTFATGSSGTDFNISSATSTHTFNFPTASATNRGLLSSADWSTFNAKQSALTNPVTGTGTTNALPKFTGASTIGNSNITDSGTLITLGSNTTISSGGLGIGTSALTGYSLRISKQITGATTAYGVMSEGAIQSDVTSNAYMFRTTPTTQATTFTLAVLAHYTATQGTIGAGSTINQQTGFWVTSSLTGGTTNNYGFRGQIPLSTGDFNLYMDGTANNYLNGSLGIGTASLTAYNLRVAQNITGATDSYGISQSGVVLSDVTSNAFGYYNSLVIQDTTFTLTSYTHFRAVQSTIGDDSTITNQSGFSVSSTLIGATNNYGFRGQIPLGANRWNLYMDGTASNYLAGKLLIGSTTDVASASVAITSTIQGFLPPRMTTTQKNAISSPATGLVVFDTTLGKLCVFATTWQTISST
jgi:hypothetical protein